MVDAPRAVRLDAALADLRAQCPDLEAASIVSYDGLPMAASLPEGMDEERVAAMCAALLSLGERASEGLGRGMLEQVSVDGEAGAVHLVSAADEAVLVGVASPSAKTGLVLFEMRRAARQVADILASPSPSAAPDPVPSALAEPAVASAGAVSASAVFAGARPVAEPIAWASTPGVPAQVESPLQGWS